MKDWFIQKLNNIAIWILRNTGYLDTLIAEISRVFEPKEENPLPEYANRAFDLVKKYDTVKESGEYKRHQVFSRLIKELPQAEKKNLGLAIELAVQKI